MSEQDSAKTAVIEAPKYGEIVDGSSPEGLAEAFLPYYPEDTKKASYLKFRVAGFGFVDSCLLADVHKKTVMRWRNDDPEFKRIDTADMATIRQKLAAQYLSIEFTRNMTLFLQKDFKILMKDALVGAVPTGEKDPATGKDKTISCLSKDEQNYLIKIRPFYTPQALAEIQQLAAGNNPTSDGKPKDFTDLVFAIRMEKDQVTVGGKFGTSK